MKDGSLKITYEFVKGKIVDHKLHINASLEIVYKRMFLQFKEKLTEKPDNIENGIFILIIGCFWLESSVNENLKFYLTHEIKNEEFGKLIWDNIKRLNFFKKLNIISLFTDTELLDEYTNTKKELEKLFEIRNRLAHFKDEDIEIDEQFNLLEDGKGADEFVDFVSRIPDPELILELKTTKIIQHSDLIVKLENWFVSTLNHYCKENKLELSNTLFNDDDKEKHTKIKL